MYLPLGDAVRAAMMRAGNQIGMAKLPDSFHGGAGRRPNDHAYWISEDRDGDGFVDHVLVYASSGITGLVLAALATAGSVWLEPSTIWSLIPVWLDRPARGGLLGPARRWKAITAYVTPARWQTDWHGSGRPGHGRRRPGLDLETQLRREISSRELPPPEHIQWNTAVHSDDYTIALDDFIIKSPNRQAPRNALKGAPTIVFPEPVSGPLAFGFGSHFGLGLMVPVE